MKEYLFAYGTLRRNYQLPLKKNVEPYVKYVGTGRIGATLYDLGQYPGAVKTRRDAIGKEVIGDVFWLTAPGRVLTVLDKYEGITTTARKAGIAAAEFNRKKTSVTLRNGTKIRAWIYWYNHDPKDKTQIRYKDYLNYLKNKSTI